MSRYKMNQPHQAKHSQSWRQLNPVDPNKVIEWALKFGALFLQALFIAAGFVAGVGLLVAFF